MGFHTLRRREASRRFPYRAGHPSVRRTFIGLAAVAWSLCLVFASHARGEESPAVLANGEKTTTKAINEHLERINSLPNLEDEKKAAIAKTLQEALRDLEAAKQSAALAKRFQHEDTTTPDDIAAVKKELASLPGEPQPVPRDASLAQLDQGLSDRTARLAAAKEKLAQCEAEPKRRAERRANVPKLVESLREKLADVNTLLQVLGAVAKPSEADVAKRLALTARRQAIEQEISAGEKELQTYEKRVQWLRLRRELFARRVALDEQEVSQWRDAVNQRRQREAEEQLKAARRAAAQAHPAIADLARRNALWAKRRTELSALIPETTGKLEQTNQELTALRERFKQTQEKVKAVGRTNAIGALLRKERENTADIRDRRKNIREIQTRIGECQYELIELEDRRSSLMNIDAEMRRCLQAAAPGDTSADDLEAAARRALETEKQYVDALIIDLNSYHYKLIDLATAEEQLVTQTVEYAKYIDERVLWIHSTTPLNWTSFSHLAQALAWMTNTEAWTQLGASLLEDTRRRPVPAALIMLVVAPFIWMQRRVRRKITEIGSVAGRANCCSILPTVETLFLTAVISCLVPAVFWCIAWRLSVAGRPAEFAEAVAPALAYTAGIYLILCFVRQMCRREGLAEMHFDWPDSALKPVRRLVHVAKLFMLPAVFVTVLMASQTNSSRADSLGRVGFIVATTFGSVLIWRTWRYRGGVYQALLATSQGSLPDRLRFLWYPLIVAVPAAMGILAAVGYYYTALQLAGRMVTSAYILLGLILVRSLLLRWVLVNRRKLAMEQARQRRAAAQAEGKACDEAPVASDMPMPPDRTLDLATINSQTRQLVKYSLAVAGTVGLWLVWVDVLPALRVLDRIPVWHAPDQTRITSLADLLISLLVLATTVIAVRNVPALLELALLPHAKIDAGLRYTITTVMRYAVIVVGILVACHFLGLRWGAVQWLVAAVSVGLGFGLQEIFANFVSGIIILFEQPVRVGDIVTVGDITGVVSRIQMRATTITNWDRKEFIVPNREFITGRLLNWTLSDQVNRIVVNVGIAYGSDTQKANDLLARIANEHPLVLDEPAPRITFEEFGDSALNYVVRCFLPDMENRLGVIHDLHMAIDREFRAAGIEIAFPQQDIHIRSIQADLGMLRGQDEKEAADSRTALPHRRDGQPKSSRHVA